MASILDDLMFLAFSARDIVLPDLLTTSHNRIFIREKGQERLLPG